MTPKIWNTCMLIAMLSAISLCLDHPVTGDLLRIESAPDRSFLGVVRKLETFRAAST